MFGRGAQLKLLSRTRCARRIRGDLLPGKLFPRVEGYCRGQGAFGGVVAEDVVRGCGEGRATAGWPGEDGFAHFGISCG